MSLKELQELLGHSSLAITMRYAHLEEGLTSSQPAAEQINASIDA